MVRGFLLASKRKGSGSRTRHPQKNRDFPEKFVNGPATYALTGVEVGACQKPQLADFVPAAYWLSG